MYLLQFLDISCQGRWSFPELLAPKKRRVHLIHLNRVVAALLNRKILERIWFSPFFSFGKDGCNTG